VGTSSRLANLRGPPAIDSSNFAIVIWFRPPATSLKRVAPSVLKVDHQRIRACSLNIDRNIHFSYQQYCIISLHGIACRWSGTRIQIFQRPMFSLARRGVSFVSSRHIDPTPAICGIAEHDLAAMRLDLSMAAVPASKTCGCFSQGIRNICKYSGCA